jgi:hypothetical protein
MTAASKVASVTSVMARTLPGGPIDRPRPAGPGGPAHAKIAPEGTH